MLLRRLCLSALLTVLPLQLLYAQDAKRTELESQIREYILRHPEVIIEAIQKYQATQRAEQEKAERAGIEQHRDELLNDPSSPAAGNPDDAATLVQFFDYRCGYCRQVSPTMVKLASGKKARVVFKELPILGPESVTLSKASLAAHRQGMERYLKFHSALMSSKDHSVASVERIATEAGLDLAKWRIDKESPEVLNAIERNTRLAQTLGVEATPTFIIGNQKIPGAMNEASIHSMLDAMRAQSPKQK